jgi:DNA repair exonuclease SbcCD ATPase subunit
MNLKLSILLATLVAGALAQDAQDERPGDRSAPLVITYSPDGLRLTEHLLQGLLQGSVGRAVHEATRMGNPDWPAPRLVIQQGPADLQQPPGYFSGLLTAQGSSGSDRALQAAVDALRVELNARLHDSAKERLQAMVAPLRAELQETERKLNAALAERARLGDLDADLEDQVRDLRAQLADRELALQVDDPLVEIEQKQVAEVEQRLRDMSVHRTKRENEALDVETKLEDLNARLQEDPRGNNLRAQLQVLRSRLLEAQTERTHLEREAEQLSHRQAALASSVQERVQRLQEARIRSAGLRTLLAECEKRFQEARGQNEERANLERQIEILQAQREHLRPRLEELRQQLDSLVPVRVDLWR